MGGSSSFQSQTFVFWWEQIKDTTVVTDFIVVEITRRGISFCLFLSGGWDIFFRNVTYFSVLSMVQNLSLKLINTFINIYGPILSEFEEWRAFARKWMGDGIAQGSILGTILKFARCWRRICRRGWGNLDSSLSICLRMFSWVIFLVNKEIVNDLMSKPTWENLRPIERSNGCSFQL